MVEGVCAKWVEAVATKKAARAGILSMVWAVSLLAGIGEALHYGMPAVTWVLGYGAGSYLAVKWKDDSKP
jgi:hypothetical protein